MIRTGLPLIRVNRATEEQFQAPGGGRRQPPPPRTREQHAAQLLRELDQIQQARRPPEQRAPGSEGQLITAAGADDLDDHATSLGDKRSSAVLVSADHGQALLHVRTDARALRRKIERYRDVDTDHGSPASQPLVARIDQLRVPTLADLSLHEFSESDLEPTAQYWVELWARGGRLDTDETRDRVREEMRWLAELGGYRGVPSRFEGVERDIFLVRLTGEVLAELPGLVPEVYEVHWAPRVRLVEALLQGEAAAAPPVEVAEPPEDAAVVAVHDTGTSLQHPYLRSVLLGSGSVVPGEPDAADRHGHGTKMAGIAIYPDYLQGVVQGVLHPQNRLVGMRLIPTPTHGPADDDPEFWAERTKNAVAEAEDLAELSATDATVVHSFSVGAANDGGLRTAWSIAVDQAAWNNGTGRLMVVAAGNVPDELLAIDAEDYPVVNLGQPMCQPAQAWNALTVGGFTALTGPPAAKTGEYPQALAPPGGISPYASTDVGGPGRPIKPDIVKEAGNIAPSDGLPNLGGEHLSLWTTSHRHLNGTLSAPTWATSPAAASAAADLVSCA